MDSWCRDDRHGIVRPHFERDGSQRHVNRDVKWGTIDGKNICFPANMMSPRPSVTGGVGQQCWDV